MNKLFGKVDKIVLGVSAAIAIVFVLWAVIWPDNASNTFSVWLSFFTGKFGWLYQLTLTVMVFFCIFLGISKAGKIKLGQDDDKPEFKTSRWFFMLFSASMGIGLVFWSVAEPVSHFITPPFAADGAAEQATQAMRTTFVHWGLHPWAVYCVIGMALAYWQFKKRKPALISSTLIPLYGEKGANGWMGKTVDILAVFATIFGVATSLGLGAMQITSGMNWVYNVPNTMTVSLVVIFALTLAFIISAVTGIRRGIMQLSNVNMILAGIIALFILFVGPTVFLANVFVDSVGTYIQDFIRVSLWTDPYGTNEGFLSGWTVFYWAWWLAWGPFVGGFVARISKGRTIRQYVLGTLIAPVLASFIFLGIMSGTEIFFQYQGINAIADAATADTASSLFALLEQFPLSAIMSTLGILLVCTFFITSADSATFVCAMMTSYGVQEPTTSLKVFWGTVEGIVAAVLLVVGGLGALQTASIVSAFPIMIVFILAMIGMYKTFIREPNKLAEAASGGASTDAAPAAKAEAIAKENAEA